MKYCSHKARLITYEIQNKNTTNTTYSYANITIKLHNNNKYLHSTIVIGVSELLDFFFFFFHSSLFVVLCLLSCSVDEINFIYL